MPAATDERAPGAQVQPTRTTVATIREMHPRCGELLKRCGDRSIRMLDVARASGCDNVSALFEREDPSSIEEQRAGIDAFTRALALLNIRTSSDRFGAWSATQIGQAFGQDAPRGEYGDVHVRQGVFGEWLRRVWISTGSVEQAADSQDRASATYFSNDFISGSVQRPYAQDDTLNQVQLQPAIPLAEVITRQRGIRSNEFRSRYLVQPVAEDIRMKRVAEGAEIPRAKITETGRSNYLVKFGRALEATYELLRYQTLEDLADYVRLLRLQTEVDQVSAAIDIMISGDGNASTAGIVHNLTTLDPGTTANNLTVTAWLAFLVQWANPYAMTHVVGQQASMLKLLQLAMPNANLLISNPSLAGISQTFTPINRSLAQGQRWGITTDAPASRLVGFDGRSTIERLFEEGSVIEEADRWITNQTEVLTFTFNEGYRIIDPSGTVHILRLDA